MKSVLLWMRTHPVPQWLWFFLAIFLYTGIHQAKVHPNLPFWECDCKTPMYGIRED